jgi:8-amino-7-oxononanoate synthase
MGESWNQRMTAAVKRWGTARTFTSGEGRPAEHRLQSFADHSVARSIRQHQKLGDMMSIESPFFHVQEARDGVTTMVQGKRMLNYAWCDYLGLSKHPALVEAAKSAIDEFGTCVSASRMVAGELTLHRQLETEVAEFLGVDDALAFVSGHAANVSTVGTLMSPGDLIIQDEFVHNSAVVGMRLSGADTRMYRHNNLDQLESILRETRDKYARILIVIEGLYSTEGDTPDLARIVELKERFGAWLMVDDAHGIGVLGKNGRGIAEHCGVDARRVDLWMGTLSKALASCGGYIAGTKEAIEILRYGAPGFVFSVGLTPPNTAAALAAVRTLRAEPDRVARLHANGQLFLEEAKKLGLDTGKSEGYAMLPIMVGHGLKTARLWQRLFDRGINSSMIIYPGVPINAGRLRFFLTCDHTPEQIKTLLRTIKEELAHC